MKHVLSISAALLLAASQAQPAMAQKNGNLVSQAVAAEGGADALRALKGLSIRAQVKYWGPEQSETPGGEARVYGDGNLTITWDLARGMARTEFEIHRNRYAHDGHAHQPAGRQLGDVGRAAGDASA